jgi:hypothetical protein
MIKKITYNCCIMTNDEMMFITGVASSVGIILGAWFLVVKFISPLLKRIHGWVDTWEKFMRDWAGTPKEPGRAAVPGVMERLNRIDGELQNNGGSSVKDAVDRIESRLKEGDEQFIELQKEIKEIKNNTKNIKN